MRKLLFVGLLCMAVFFAGVAVIAQDTKPAAVPPAKVEAVKEPSKQWLDDYESFLVLQRAIADMKKEYGIDKLEERLNQRGVALQAGIPAGYNFDQTKKQFVAIAKPQEPAKK